MALLLRTLALAGLEAAVVGLPLLALTSADLPWALLLVLVLFGRLADAIALRLPAHLERPVFAAGALGVGLLLIGLRLGLGPLAAFAALLPGHPQFAVAYGLLLLAIYLYWRGLRLAQADGAVAGALFGRGAVVLVVVLLLRPLVRPGVELPGAALFGQVVAFVSLGLLALALSQGQDEEGGRRLSWPWLLALALAIGGVLLAGGALATLLGGGTALAAAQALLGAILLPFALVGAALAWLILTLFAGPLALIAQALRQLFARIGALTQPPQEQAGDAFTNTEPSAAIVALAHSATWLMALIPIVILVLAILLLRRRRPVARPDEERESLGLAENLAGDLRDLLGRLRNPFARPLVGLRAALAALAGDAPERRVRRAYLRLLIALEPRSPRPAPQTPAEYAAAAAVAAGAATPVAQLTRAYERARYNPAGVAPADAAEAEAALAAIDQSRSRT